MGLLMTFWGPKNFFDPVLDSAGVALATQAVVGQLPNIAEPNRPWNVQRMFLEVEGRVSFGEICVNGLSASLLKTVELAAMIALGFLAMATEAEPFARAKKTVIELVITTQVSVLVGLIGVLNPVWGVKAYMFLMIMLAKLGSEYWAQYAEVQQNIAGGARVALEGQEANVIQPLSQLIGENCSLGRKLICRILQELGKESVASRVEAPDFAGILSGLRALQASMATVQPATAPSDH